MEDFVASICDEEVISALAVLPVRQSFTLPTKTASQLHGSSAVLWAMAGSCVSGPPPE
jgi:hypothetical protein